MIWHILCVAMIVVSTATARMFRMGTVSWNRSLDDPLLVTFDATLVLVYDPHTMSRDSHTVNGSVFQMIWGDVGTAKGLSPPTSTLMGITDDGYMVCHMVISHRYPVPRCYTPFHSQCCRNSISATDVDVLIPYRVGVGVDVHIESSVASSPRFTNAATQLSFNLSILNTYQVNVSCDCAYNLTFAPCEDAATGMLYTPSGLLSRSPPGMTLVNDILAWIPTVGGHYSIQLRASRVDNPSVWSSWDVMVIVVG
jgi:hypothetical protein